MARLFRISAILTLVLLTLGASISAFAQNENPVVNQTVDYSFGEWIVFDADLDPNLKVKQVQLVIDPRGENNGTVHEAELRGSIHAQFVYETSAEGAIRAFNNVDYYYLVTLESGQQLQSPDYNFFYIDNRFPWQVLPGDSFIIYWYQGDLSFGQAVLDTARTSLDQIDQYVQLAPFQPVHIFVYAKSSDLRDALTLTGQTNWVAGHADPDLGIALVSIEPGPEQVLDMERQVPHEIAHLRLYQTLGDSYQALPAWLNEGLASISELYPNPDYNLILSTAYDNQALLPLSALCSSFPQDAANATLAYAQSDSFIRFLYQGHGAAGLTRLMNDYANGESCEGGAQKSLGRTLTQLESDWRKATFEENIFGAALSYILPWIWFILIFSISPIIYFVLFWRKAKS